MIGSAGHTETECRKELVTQRVTQGNHITRRAKDQFMPERVLHGWGSD